VACEEPGKVRFSLHVKHGEIASVDHLPAPCPTLLNQILKMWVHLWRPTGNIHRRDLRGAVENLQDLIHGGLTHTFGPLGTGINMAMVAGLVADFPDIDLKGGNRLSLEGKRMMDGQRLFKRGSYPRRLGR
jgi:hypothetical protein